MRELDTAAALSPRRAAKERAGRVTAEPLAAQEWEAGGAASRRESTENESIRTDGEVGERADCLIDGLLGALASTAADRGSVMVHIVMAYVVMA